MSLNSAPSAVVPVPPPAPVLSGLALSLQGTVAVGSSLSAAQASANYFTGVVDSYGYSWLRCNAGGGACTAISLAAASSYTLTTADEGYTLRERISATNGGGSLSLDSAASALVPVPPVVAGHPAQAGEAAEVPPRP